MLINGFGSTVSGLNSLDYCYYCVKSQQSNSQALLWKIVWNGRQWKTFRLYCRHRDGWGRGQLSQTLLWMLLQIQSRVLHDIFRIWQIFVWFGYFLCTLAGRHIPAAMQQSALMAEVTPTSEAEAISNRLLLTHDLSWLIIPLSFVGHFWFPPWSPMPVPILIWIPID